MAVFALDEEVKCLQQKPGHKSPESLEVKRKNMLRSTVLDSEMKSIMGNEHDMLPNLLQPLQQFAHNLAKSLGGSCKIERYLNISIEQPENTTDHMLDIDNDIDHHHDKSDNEGDRTIPDSNDFYIIENKQ